jgi:hypothetical protein
MVSPQTVNRFALHVRNTKAVPPYKLSIPMNHANERERNTQGTINYQPRIHKFGITFTPKPSATVAAPSGPNLVFTYQDTTLLYGPDGKTPCTGLDADPAGHISYPGFPPLPGATFLGDGWGNGDTIQRAITIDGEGLALGNDGTFWISDEYGPYVYQFKPNGKMITAIRPVDASTFSLLTHLLR